MADRLKAEARKKEIVDCAIRLADELGPDGLTASALARCVGVTQPAIFRHFPSMPDLWRAVTARLAEELERHWERSMQAGPGPLQRLEALALGQLGLIERVPALPAILFSRELHAKNPVLRAEFGTMLKRYHGLLAATLAEARDRALIRADLDPEVAAFLVIAVVQGTALRWSLGGRRRSLAAEGRRVLAELMKGFEIAAHREEGPLRARPAARGKLATTETKR
ncbi:MAG: TetR/AcrR family transcriptional regulator [Pseudomonadota bacterium]